jgi:hypothetical protein
MMEGITRIVAESLARHGFDRPLDYRRLHWSRWFRCESHHSLLVVPSKPGVFAIAEEILDLDPARAEGQSRRPEAGVSRRMLAVTQFFADDDMAYVLDRMLSRENPMRARLASGRYFVRFVEIQDESQRRSICNALNQWVANSGEKASGIGAHFATSLELAETTVGRAPSPAIEVSAPGKSLGQASTSPATFPATAPHLDPGAAGRVLSPAPFPSGF